MNYNILHTEVQEFINKNLKSDIHKLILKGSPFKNITVQELSNQIVAKKKSETKLPTWFAAKNMYYPSKISIEQTSSELAAEYKSKLISGKNIIDITGGFGIDAFYFSKVFTKVIHCEINLELSKIVSHNYTQLAVKNITTIASNGLDYSKHSNKKFDAIYIDPSRRNDKKGKVFLLKDCLPNIPENLEFLFSKSNIILIKNSPLLDITNGIKELNFVKEIHVVAINNDVKELLFLLEKNYNKKIKIKTINIKNTGNQLFNFQLDNIYTSVYSKPLIFLYEPNAAILKAGGFHQISKQLGLYKLQEHSHLYTSKEFIKNFPGRKFKIEQVLPYQKKEIKKFKKAHITTRNFPETVAQIRKKNKLISGGDTYLFFTKNINKKLIVIVCRQFFS